MLAASSPRIVFSKVSVSAGQQNLLSDINLVVEPGTWLGIVGPNGGGKSTLLKALLGLLPHHGEISMDWFQGEKGKLGYVPQLAPFDPTIPVTVTDYLRMVSEDRPLWRRPKQRKAIRTLLAQFDIDAFADTRVGALSTGERQRVLMCGAMMNSPDLLLLDEPFAGVDKKGHEQLLNILQDFHRQGKSILMVEHNWRIVEAHCQQVALIDRKLQANGPPLQVFSSLQQHTPVMNFEKRA